MKLGLAVLLLTMQSVMAAELTSISDFDGCRSIAADTERLLCYDTVADGGVFDEQKLRQVQEENFGSPDKKSDVNLDQVTVTVVRIRKSNTGKHYFHTAQDTVWKQSVRGKWNIKAPFQAEIKAGKLGSYFLVTESGKSVRVKRVR